MCERMERPDSTGAIAVPKTVPKQSSGNPIPDLTEKMTQRLRLIRWRLARIAGTQVSDRVAAGGQGPRKFFDRACIPQNNFIRLIDRVRGMQQTLE